MYCLDWDKLGDTLEIWGDTFTNQYVDFVLTPCNYNHTAYGKTDSVIPE